MLCIRGCALIVTAMVLSSCGGDGSATAESTVAAALAPSVRMADGREWSARNLAVSIDHSYCYEGGQHNCDRYGRLYTWEAAQRACLMLGNGWRLPTDGEWLQMAKPFGGAFGDSVDDGKGAYAALVTGGKSGLDIVFGGNRNPDGSFARIDAHGLYWTSSTSESGGHYFYNFGRQRFLNRHSGGNPQMALSVRCIRET
jgi:uncharacterized protein (TIGR02145 family)